MDQRSFLSRLFDPTGAGKGQSETPVTRSPWWDLGGGRVNAEDKNRKREDKKAARKEARKNKDKKPFFY